MPLTGNDLKLIADTIRTLSMDAVQKANSGHPGMPMGCADIAAVLWGKILKHNPDDPGWADRDRFILSAGHGSMLLYSLLHFAGYDLTIDDIKNFRQFGSKTPGHPEFGHTKGVETTTGPLGQGFANGVGMAYAAKMFAAEFNTDGEILDHTIYAIVSDGDLMEGLSSEAASLAGHWGLGNIVYIYDSNDISIEGSTNLAFSEDIEKRFEAYNWHVQKIDGHNYDQIEKSIIAAKNEKAKPSIIIAKTSIAKGSFSKEGSESSHGAPLGEEEIRNSKVKLGWNPDEKFVVPERVYELFTERKEELNSEYKAWNDKFNAAINGEKRDKWDSFFVKPDIKKIREKLPFFDAGSSAATRGAGGKVLESLFKEMPNLLGGSADLGPSNKTFVKGFSETGNSTIGRNIHFGIRENAMGSIQNGIAYYGGFIPFSSTFLVFMDYMRPAVRIAALAKLHSIYVFTHDSFFVGEDGPTHQPVEHMAAARCIPNLTVIRPADAEETREAWLAAIDRNDGPVMMSLTRQDVPVLEREGADASALFKGAYIIKDCSGEPDIILLASGSEVHVAVSAAEKLSSDSIKSRVVSFPSWELFDMQDEEYRKSILPDSARFAVIEAGRSMGWERYTGRDALFVTIEDFGISAPAKVLAEHFGFSGDSVAAKVKTFLGK